MNQIRTRMAQGEIPGNELVDGLLILFAGALMLTPGFITDGVGLLLLFPPTRMAVRSVLMRRYSKRITVAGWPPGSGGSGGPGGTRRFRPTLDAESFPGNEDGPHTDSV